MIISLLVAMSKNRVIGRANALPWHLPEDMKFFKRITMGKPVVMGRATYESIGKPLAGRANIVITRNSDYAAEGIHVVNSVDDALALSAQLTAPDLDTEIMVIGGAQIFAQTLPIAHRIYLTELNTIIEGDVYFPEFPRDQWTEVARENRPATEANPYTWSFLILERESFE
jgi:dihydrofolate reductase